MRTHRKHPAGSMDFPFEEEWARTFYGDAQVEPTASIDVSKESDGFIYRNIMHAQIGYYLELELMYIRTRIEIKF